MFHSGYSARTDSQWTTSNLDVPYITLAFSDTKRAGGSALSTGVYLYTLNSPRALSHKRRPMLPQVPTFFFFSFRHVSVWETYVVWSERSTNIFCSPLTRYAD